MACGLKTPLWHNSLLFIYWTGIDLNSLSTMRTQMLRSTSTATLTSLEQYHLPIIMVSGVAYIIFLYLVWNVFLARYDSGKFLCHLTDGGFDFNAVGTLGIDIYQMYVVTPMVKGGMLYIRLGLVYKPRGLFAGNVEKFATILRTSIDVRVKAMWPPAKHTSFERGGVWDLSVTQCHLGSV